MIQGIYDHRNVYHDQDVGPIVVVTDFRIVVDESERVRIDVRSTILGPKGRKVPPNWFFFFVVVVVIDDSATCQSKTAKMFEQNYCR